MASQRRRLHTALTAAALPGMALGALVALPLTPVQAQTAGADLKVVSPRPGTTLGAAAFSLDVNFHSRTSAPITAAELWVDGVRWVHRDLDTPQIKNVLSFAVDSSSLSQGTHTFLVRVLTANGGSGETTLQAITGSEGASTTTGLGAPAMKFSAPLNGRRVMGKVELELDAKAKDGVNPWVTIYVDKQFKNLSNQPPYNYTWDTTGVANGLHVIEATGYLESSKQSTSQTIKVFVDNPGGNTALKSDIPDLSVSGAAKNTLTTAKSVAIALPAATQPALVPVGEPIVSDIAHAATDAAPSSAGLVSALPVNAPVVHSLLALHAPSAASLLAHGNHSNHSSRTMVAAVSHHLSAAATTPVLASNHLTVASADAVEFSPQMTAMSPTVALRPVALAGLAAPHLPVLALHAAGTSVTSALTASIANHAVTHSVARHIAGIAKSRSITPTTVAGIAPMTSPVTPVLLAPFAPTHAATGAHRKVSHAGMRAAIRPHHEGILQAAEFRPVAVAFNGQQIAFDVQPRVEAGLPIAPFRQIFEHTGGQVDWVEKTQVVHAVNASKEIVIKVGAKAATVNGQNVSLARPAFTERGRTIVPLSFVGTALDVDVKYDAVTGRIQITSK